MRGAGWRRWGPVAFLLAWPFLYFAPLVCLPGLPCHGLGNDFLPLYYRYKVYLLDYLARWQLPLWSPSEAAGFPFYSNPFPAVFYPLNALLAPLYAAAGGYSALDHQRFTVAGVSILAVGLFAWLRSLGHSTRAALVAAATLSVSFKVAEILRLPNALHAAAWYPWLLYGVTRVVQSPRQRGKLGGGAVTLAACVCLLTAGYPYYAYYAQFLVLPYLVLLLVPRLARAMGVAPPAQARTAVAVLAASAAASLLLCAPYLAKMAALLDQTADRAGGSFAFATEGGFSWQDTVGSLLYPPAAQSEGWLYFSAAGLLLVLLYMAAAPRATAAARAAFALWIALVFSIAHGAESPLFRAAWAALPGFSRLRMWGRLHIVLVPVLAWLLARAWTHVEELTPEAARRSLVLLAPAYAALAGVQAFFFASQTTDPYWRHFVRFWSLEPRFLWFGLAGFLGLAAALALAAWRPAAAAGAAAARAWGVAAAFVLLAALDMGQMGNRLWMVSRVDATRTTLRLDRATAASLAVPRSVNEGPIMLGPRHSVAIIPNWDFSRYVAFVQVALGEPDAWPAFMGVSEPRRLFFTREIRHPSLRAFLDDARALGDLVRATSYDGDRLVAEVDAPAPGYVSFIDNWDPDWRGEVDGTSRCVEPLFGTFKALPVPAGRHRVAFSYRPRILGRGGC